MKILITGGAGQLAWDISQRASSAILCTHQECDITKASSIQRALTKYQPDIIVNTAAYTAVDKAEQETEEAFRVNRDGAKQIAIACEKACIPLIHLSTDYVFDGKSSRAYHEEDKTAPLNVYGISKWEGEQAVRQQCTQHILLRVSGVFGVRGQNFVKTILRLAAEREVLRVVADQVTCPTPAADIAETILVLVKKCLNLTDFKEWGTYHYCSAEPTTWHHFAESIIKEAMATQPLRVRNLEAITTADYPTPAKRPAYSVLNCEKIAKVFGIKNISWRSGLAQVIVEWMEGT